MKKANFQVGESRRGLTTYNICAFLTALNPLLCQGSPSLNQSKRLLGDGIMRVRPDDSLKTLLSLIELPQVDERRAEGVPREKAR